jgi:DNA-binding transcriptional ArsR family regulator
MLDRSASLDQVFRALSDPSRRAIVERLVRGPASVSELARPLAMTLAAVVQHVQALEASGLIRTRKLGRVRTCEIAPSALARAERWLARRRESCERRPGALDDRSP